MDLSNIDLSDYPELARPFRWRWAPIDAGFEMLDEHPEDRLISNVRIVPFIADESDRQAQVVVLKMDNGHWNHPGGTREPGEPYPETARRELMEEAGDSVLRAMSIPAAWRLRNSASMSEMIGLITGPSSPLIGSSGWAQRMFGAVTWKRTHSTFRAEVE